MWDLRQKQWGNLAFDYVVNPQRDPEWTWWILKEGGKRLKDTHRRYQLFLKAVALLYVMIWKHLNIDSQDKSSPQFFCMYLLLTDAHLFSLSPLLLQKQKKQKTQRNNRFPCILCSHSDHLLTLMHVQGKCVWHKKPSSLSLSSLFPISFTNTLRTQNVKAAEQHNHVSTLVVTHF